VIPRERERLLRNEPDTQNEPNTRHSRMGREPGRADPIGAQHRLTTGIPERVVTRISASNAAAKARNVVVGGWVLLGFWRSLIGE